MSRITVDQLFDYGAKLLDQLPTERVQISDGTYCVTHHMGNRTFNIALLRDELGHVLHATLQHKYYPWRIISIGSLEECEAICKIMRGG